MYPCVWHRSAIGLLTCLCRTFLVLGGLGRLRVRSEISRGEHRLSRRHIELRLASPTAETDAADAAAGVQLFVTGRGQNSAYYCHPLPGGCWTPIPAGGVMLANLSLIAALGDGRAADDAKQYICEPSAAGILVFFGLLLLLYAKLFIRRPPHSSFSLSPLSLCLHCGITTAIFLCFSPYSLLISFSPSP